MKCKFCQAELEEGVTLCPACGQENLPEETAKKKMTSTKLAVIYICIIALLAVLIAPVIMGLKNGGSADKDAQYSGGVIFADGNEDDVTCKGSYTVSDRKAKSKANKVIATAGDAELTNGMLQSIYWLQVYNFMGEYGKDYNIQENMPLEEQMCFANEKNWSWQQYFLDVSLREWQMYNAFCQEAKAVGFEGTTDMAALLENMKTSLEKTAADEGFATVEELILNDMGPGASLEAYLQFLELTERAYDYYEHLYNTLEPTEDQIRAYYEENLALFEENGVTDDGSVLVDVRHILLQPADAENEQEWLDCEKQAQDLLDQWLAGEADEDSFAALANEHSSDPGSKTKGGLYEYVQKGRMVPEFNDWCFDASRQYGDYDIIKTSYGYHIMFFVQSEPVWHVYAKNSAASQLLNDTMEALLEKYPVDVKFSEIVIGEPQLMLEN